MGYIKNGTIEKMRKRLDSALRKLAKPNARPLYGPDDLGVLSYVRAQITPERLEERGGEDDRNMSKLIAVAGERLAPYESEGR